MRVLLPGRRRRPELRRTSLTTRSFSIEPDGPFSLREAASFGFGPAAGDGGDSVRLAFVADGFTDHAAAQLVQDRGSGVVYAEVRGAPADPPTMDRQVRRFLPLDHSGKDSHKVGRRDAVIRDLQKKFKGLRPVLFNPPYEAAAWAVLSQRRRRTQAMTLRKRL